MPDTGQAAGQQVEFALRLTQNGSALSYADATAFEADGWELVYRAAQADQTPSYTIQPHSDADLEALGWHMVVLTTVNGQGPLIAKAPTTGSGWKAFPAAFQIAAESTDNDDLYSAILRGTGVATAASLTTTADYLVKEGDSLTREVPVLESAITIWDWTAENLADGTLTLDAAVRASDNRVGIPNAWMAVTVKTAATGSDPVLRLSWSTYPAARALVQAGMEYASTDITNDADITPIVYNFDVQMTGTKTYPVTAVSTGSKTFTMAGDRRRWFSQGGQFAVAGSTGNNGTFTVVSVAYAGGNTTVTVSETVSSAVADGNVVITIKSTLVDGTITAERQETRS